MLHGRNARISAAEKMCGAAAGAPRRSCDRDHQFSAAVDCPFIASREPRRDAWRLSPVHPPFSPFTTGVGASTAPLRADEPTANCRLHYFRTDSVTDAEFMLLVGTSNGEDIRFQPA